VKLDANSVAATVGLKNGKWIFQTLEELKD
jgi:hypothetical protein